MYFRVFLNRDPNSTSDPLPCLGQADLRKMAVLPTELRVHLGLAKQRGGGLRKVFWVLGLGFGV